ncbi:adenosylcobinamide-phosphate synthase CbiB [Sneathiella litorea]|uniref:Cobalamin biosynthesis protein CobD n=1 Tax=Sneathiella litorea TaxID=2606216 RepID=A0A6L8WAX7_9PROT|nr:adenosylcobinamide-phosphate synthase CbiB [Sneathiella litorea]MZR31307.1 cobalamin biosynthesis protein CobD [Sneathiella litorea]
MSSLLFTTNSAFYTPPLIVLLALIIDALAGDPKWLYRIIPHPVVLLGKLISVLEGRTNNSRESSRQKLIRGIQCSAAVIAAAAIAGYVLALLCQTFPAGMILLAILASSLIAWRGLYTHVRDVMIGLNQSLDAGREAVSHIVGRDPESLDESAISRAAIESLAENFSDGTVAPVFWFAALGLPGLCTYKAINTLDSMIGHRNERYEYFGKAAARIDDAVNYIPARLTGFLIVIAACLVKGANAKNALKAMFRDASRHRSFNAGWPEAAMAGALDVALAGPRIYDGVEVPDGWMNENGAREIGPEHILRALLLYRVAGGLIMALLLGLAFVIYSFS